MDSPFYRSHWGSSPRYPPNFRAVPISNSKTTPLPSHKPPKVVSIPVQFVQAADNSSKPNPNPNSRSDYAIRIQKLFRGFRVRKNTKKLLEIQQELREVETAILDSETVEAIKRDERERLKVSERLMSLLFRLDSMGGFDCAVKDLRKTLIRRAIVLQEKVDSISVIDQAEKLIEDPPESNCQNQPSDLQDEELQSDSESCGTSPCLMEGEEKNQQEEEEEEPVEKEVVVVEEKSSAMEESKRSREMLERMVEENNKLMTLMADLFDKNEKQTRILSSLSERVGQLENAFACEKLKRRAKKQKKTKNSKSLDNTEY